MSMFFYDKKKLQKGVYQPESMATNVLFFLSCLYSVLRQHFEGFSHRLNMKDCLCEKKTVNEAILTHEKSAYSFMQ